MAKKNGELSSVEKKIRASFMIMLDKFNETERDRVLKTYQNKKLLKTYEDIRNSGKYEKSGGKAHHRKIVEFPNPSVFEFCNKIMTARFGVDWLYDNRALKDELVKPWWLVKKL